MNTIRQLLEKRIIDQDKAGSRLFKKIEGAASLQEALKGRHLLPCAYVYRVNVTARDNIYGTGNVEQETQEFYAIAIVSKSLRTSGGADSSDDSEILCKTISDAILGWPPVIGGGYFSYAGGSLVSFDNKFYIWQELYKIRTERVSIN